MTWVPASLPPPSWTMPEVPNNLFDAAIFDSAIFDTGESLIWSNGSPVEGSWSPTTQSSQTWTGTITPPPIWS